MSFKYENINLSENINKWLIPVIKTFGIIFLILICSKVDGQEPAYKNYTTTDGLASINVYSAIQDDDGFMWFATDNGVSRFDGTRFKNFSVADGLSDNSVLRIAKDSKGRLWFLTFNGKLSYYKDGRIHNSFNDSLIRKIKFTNAILYFFEDSKKNIWISSDQTLIRISESNVTTLHGLQARMIFEDKNGIIRALSCTDVYQFNNTLFTSKKIKLDAKAFLPYQKDSAILIVTPDGTAKYSINTDEYKYLKIGGDYTGANIQGLFTDNKNNVWIALINGVSKFENGILSAENEQTFFKNYSITNVYTDKNDNIWFCSKGAGVFIVPSLRVRMFNIKSGLVENNISSLALIGQDLMMIGTNNGSIQLLEDDVIKDKYLSLVNPAGSVIKIVRDLNGDAWILNNEAILKYHNGKFYTITSTWNKTIFVSHNGTIWMGWGRGIRKIINDKVVSVFQDSVINRFYAIEEIGDDLMLGSDKGLYRYHNGKMIFEGPNDTLLRHRINSLAVTSDSTLWIATDGYGLLSINHGVLSSYTIKDHLLSNHCNSLFTDGDKVYIGSDKGLNVIRKVKAQPEIISYSSANGLICGNINQIVKLKKNTFFLATDQGIMEFDEDALHRTSSYTAYVNSVIVNDVPVPVSSSYNFHNSENNIQFEFGAINFNNEGNVHYRYKLSGLDSGWNYSSSASVKYSSLKPGNYTFLVSATYPDYKLKSTIASISFFIETPWWQTWWFKAICIVSGIIVLFIIVRWRIRVYNKKLEQQKYMAESELKALRAQINPHFIYNSLNSIQDFIMENQKQDANLYLAKFAKLMRNILSHSRLQKISLAEEMESLTLYLELESLRFNNRFGFAFEIAPDINIDEILIPSMILQPYVENAILHGLSAREEGGQLKISFYKKESNLVCTIEDNGIGRKKAGEIRQQKLRIGGKSLGMKITGERIDLLNFGERQKINLEIADLKDEKNNACGTRVTVFFPLT